MQEETFVPALVELRNCDIDTVIAKLHKMFSEISKMDAATVTAAFQTIRCVSECADLEKDTAIIHALSACHQRMVALVYKEMRPPEANRMAIRFCSLIGIGPATGLNSTSEKLANHKFS